MLHVPLSETEECREKVRVPKPPLVNYLPNLLCPTTTHDYSFYLIPSPYLTPPFVLSQRLSPRISSRVTHQ